MASTISSFSLRALSLPRARTACHEAKAAPAVGTNRRKLLLSSLTAVLTAKEAACFAQDIPLFGLRKSVRKAEEEAVRLVKEAEREIETAEKEIETAKREIETAEREIETAEIEIEAGVGFGGLAQAGAVAGAEVAGLLVATSIVNGILAPQK